MRTVQPTTDLTLSMDKLARMLAESLAFQVRVNETTSQGALKHIWWPHLQKDDMQGSRPCAVISQPTGFAQQRLIAGNPSHYVPNGSLELGLYDNGRYEDVGDDYTDFADWCGNVLDDVLSLGTENDWLNIASAKFSHPPAVSDPTKSPAQLRFWECWIEIEWDTVTL